MSDNRVIIFDTTLRDGEQSPGATMHKDEKILIADVLDAMGVDVIEAGFAAASNGDFDAIHGIAKRAKRAVVCSLARAKLPDIERAGEAVKPCKNGGRVHTFISTSDIHLKYQFKMTHDEVLIAIKESVEYARTFTDNVEWSAMDATRSGLDYLCKAVETAITAGATTINLPDTVGYALPWEYAGMIREVRERVPNSDKAIFSVHCQNDLGLATANSLAALDAGVRQIECTINGLGERAGNTSLEEVVMAIDTREELLPYKTGIDTTYIMRASKLVSNISGFQVQKNKAIVGANAFAHESGIHQHGVLENAETYEIMKPESIGLKKSSLVLGKHSGRHAFKDKLKELGIELGDNAFQDAFQRFKDLADKKKEIFEDDILAIIDDRSLNEETIVQFKHLEVTCGSVEEQKVSLTLVEKDEEKSTTLTGTNGPVDVCFTAIRELISHDARLDVFNISAVTKGIDAQAEVNVRLETEEGRLINGIGVDTDIVTASVKAYVHALNRLLAGEEKIGLV